MPGKLNLLIVDGDPAFQDTARLVLSSKFNCDHVATSAELFNKDLSRYKAILLDIELGHGLGGFQTLKVLRFEHPGIPVIMISRREDIGPAVKAMRFGAADYIGKQVNLFELSMKVEKALSQLQLEEKEQFLTHGSLNRSRSLVGESPAIKKVKEAMWRAASVNSPVLITGESGTGKELVARGIHELSERMKKPFVSVNCSAIPETLFESLLFGHERGTFTGAERRQKGHVENAGRGTLFLDEVAEMPVATQSKLLRVIQEKHFFRLGSHEQITMEARLLAASNRDLEAALSQETFRRDLYYRLNVLRIHIPPLREHLEDLASLVDDILRKKSLELNKPIPRVSQSALQCLYGWDWPGNVRELENVLEGALVQSSADILQPEHILSLQQHQSLSGGFTAARRMAVERFERQYVQVALRTCKGNISEAARRMKVSRFGLQKILKRLGMDAQNCRVMKEARGKTEKEVP